MHHIDQSLEEKEVSGDGPYARTDDHAVERLLGELLSNHVCSRVSEVRQAEFCFVAQCGKSCLVRPKPGPNLVRIHVRHRAEVDQVWLQPNHQYQRLLNSRPIRSRNRWSVVAVIALA